MWCALHIIQLRSRGMLAPGHQAGNAFKERDSLFSHHACATFVQTFPNCKARTRRGGLESRVPSAQNPSEI